MKWRERSTGTSKFTINCTFYTTNLPICPMQSLLLPLAPTPVCSITINIQGLIGPRTVRKSALNVPHGGPRKTINCTGSGSGSVRVRGRGLYLHPYATTDGATTVAAWKIKANAIANCENGSQARPSQGMPGRHTRIGLDLFARAV